MPGYMFRALVMPIVRFYTDDIRSTEDKARITAYWLGGIAVALAVGTVTGVVSWR